MRLATNAVVVYTNFYSMATITATNGYASYATNATIVSSSTTISNNQPNNMRVWLTAATGLSMTNSAAKLVFSGQTVAALTQFDLQPTEQLVGTAITCVGTNGF
jgi:hypothetical protein